MVAAQALILEDNSKSWSGGIPFLTKNTQRLEIVHNPDTVIRDGLFDMSDLESILQLYPNLHIFRISLPTDNRDFASAVSKVQKPTLRYINLRRISDAHLFVSWLPFLPASEVLEIHRPSPNTTPDRQLVISLPNLHTLSISDATYPGSHILETIATAGFKQFSFSGLCNIAQRCTTLKLAVNPQGRFYVRKAKTSTFEHKKPR
jgi:hypothetical protein